MLQPDLLGRGRWDSFPAEQSRWRRRSPAGASENLPSVRAADSPFFAKPESNRWLGYPQLYRTNIHAQRQYRQFNQNHKIVATDGLCLALCFKKETNLFLEWTEKCSPLKCPCAHPRSCDCVTVPAKGTLSVGLRSWIWSWEGDLG